MEEDASAAAAAAPEPAAPQPAAAKSSKSTPAPAAAKSAKSLAAAAAPTVDLSHMKTKPYCLVSKTEAEGSQVMEFKVAQCAPVPAGLAAAAALAGKQDKCALITVVSVDIDVAAVRQQGPGCGLGQMEISGRERYVPMEVAAAA